MTPNAYALADICFQSDKILASFISNKLVLRHVLGYIENTLFEMSRLMPTLKILIRVHRCM